MRIIYQIGIYLYYLIILIASIFNAKAKQWIKGRNAQRQILKTNLPNKKRIWFHFASLGEFEQGRVLVEKIKEKYKDFSIVITFFSPSGYEIRKNYPLAEKVYYLPLDTPKNAKLFLNHINPSFIFFNKYEYWYNYISEANQRDIPLFVNSAIFRKNQIYFKWYGSFYRRILKNVKYFFIQNDESAFLLSRIKINNFQIFGDTRFDRVYENSLNPKSDPIINDFCNNSNVLVAGSTWEKDEVLIKSILDQSIDLKTIIVPHELSKVHLANLTELFKDNANLYSTCVKGNSKADKKILIVDTIGLLSSIYRQAKYCYIGGGFGAGIHNTLEAAAYGKPIFFGPNYQKFSEAKALIQLNSAHSVQNANELISHIKKFESNASQYQDACAKSKEFVYSNKGASAKIIEYLIQVGLLN